MSDDEVDHSGSAENEEGGDFSSGDMVDVLSDVDEEDLSGLINIFRGQMRNLEERNMVGNSERAAIEEARLQRADEFKKDAFFSWGRPCARVNLANLVQERELGQCPRRLDFSRELLPCSPGKMVASLRFQMFSGKYSPDGLLFAASSQDSIIRLFDATDWMVKKTIRAREVEWAVLDTDYSPDMRWLAYSTWSNKIQLVNTHGNVETHQAYEIRPVSRQRFCLFSLRFSPLSTEVIGGSSDGSVYLCDLVADKTVRFAGHEDDVNAVSYICDSGNIFCSGSDDNTIRVWDKRCESPCVGIFSGHCSGITSLDSTRQRFICSNSKDQTIKLWDLRSLSCAASAERVAAGRYRGPAIDYRGPAVLAEVLQQMVHSQDQSVMTYKGHRVLQTLCRAYFSPVETTDARFIYVGSFDGSIKIYDVLTGSMVGDLHGHEAVARDVSWHPWLPQITSVSWDGTMRSWSSASRHCMFHGGKTK